MGRDVESMIRDLVETSVRIVQQERMKVVEDKAAQAAEERLVELIVPLPRKRRRQVNPPGFSLSGGGAGGRERRGG